MDNCFYAVNSPTNPLAQLYTSARSQEYETWLKLIPDSEADYELLSEDYAHSVGESSDKVIKTLLALQRLTTELPQLYDAITTHWHLDFPRIIAIDGALSKLGPNPDPIVMTELDAKITRYLTPRSSNQLLPSPSHIAQRVRQMVHEYDERVSVKDPRPKRRVVKTKESDNSSSLTIEAPHEEIEAANECVKATAKEHGISRADAILKILTGDIPARLVTTTLAMFTAKDLDNAPAFLQGVGWVGPETVERLKEGAKVSDMDDAATAVTDSYRPTEAIRLFVEGRDGTCRWPGCSVPAENCQLDHRHNFDEGGPTSASNLFCLCQHHHNIKTDTRAMYIVDPISDVSYWLFENGTWVADDAEDGPIGKGSKKWLQNFGQKVDGRRRNSQERAHEQTEQIEDWYKERDEEDRRRQETQDVMDDLWVDDVKLAQACLQEGDFSKPFPLLMSPNVFMLVEAARRMGLDFTASDDIDGWVRVHKKIAAAEEEELARRIQQVADEFHNLLPEDQVEEFKRKAAHACKQPHDWKRSWQPNNQEADSNEAPPF